MGQVVSDSGASCIRSWGKLYQIVGQNTMSKNKSDGQLYQIVGQDIADSGASYIR